MAAHTEPQYDELGHHISSARVYWIVFGALVVFTGLTYLVSFADLGPASLPVAMLVAAVKASLVCAFFMHLKYDTKFNVLVFTSSFFFMAVFFAFTMLDVGSRALIDPIEGHGVIEHREALAAQMAAAAEVASDTEAEAADTDAAAAEEAAPAVAAPPTDPAAANPPAAEPVAPTPAAPAEAPAPGH